jgi:hypothetical protein
VVTPDKYHPPLLLGFNLTLGCHRISLSPHRTYAQGDCLLHYNDLHHCDWSCVLNENSVDSAVNYLTAILREAIKLAIPHRKSKNSTFPHWFSDSLKYCIKKKNQRFRKYRKSKSDRNYSVFSYYRKLVKPTIKTDKLRWLKSIDDSLKTKPKDFWKYVSKLKKINHVTQLKIGKHLITQAQCTVEAFEDNFFSIFNPPST